MLYFFTLISLAIIIFIVPVWFANGIEILNGTRSKLRYVPVINECRAERLFLEKIGPVTVSWILLPLTGVASIATWYFMFGSILQIICHYAFFVALGFWYVAKVIDCVIITRDLGLISAASGIFVSFIYPLGYYNINAMCKTFLRTKD